MEKNNAPKPDGEASMVAKQDLALSEEEKMIAMEVAKRIQVRIRNGDLAKEENQVALQEEIEVEETYYEMLTPEPDEASKEEKKPSA